MEIWILALMTSGRKKGQPFHRSARRKMAELELNKRHKQGRRQLHSYPAISYREAKQVAPECPMPVVEPHLALTAPLSSNRQDNL
jgi:hypothetical protein